MKTQSWKRRPGTHPGSCVTYGEGAIASLPSLLKTHRWRRLLVVRGKRSFVASGAARVMPELNRAADLVEWDDFSVNPEIDDLSRGLGVLREFDPEAVIAVGGGSPMDMAKLLCAFDRIDGRSLEERIGSEERVDARDRALVLVPTTSGSGSEATRFAVVHVGPRKFSVEGMGLEADEVILDPELSLGSSAYQRATSGIDAVAQAMESLWAISATARSRRLSRIALTLLLPAIEAFVHTPDSGSARAMCLGSHLAGRAINLSKTTAAHALSYAITRHCDVSHGHAVALTLGQFIERHAGAGQDDLHRGIDPRHHELAMNEILRRLGADEGRTAKENFIKLMRDIGLEPSLSKLCGSSPTDPTSLASAVNPQRLANNPVAFEREDLIRILSVLG